MFGASVVVGIAILGFAIWLEWREAHGGMDPPSSGLLDERYLAARRRLRRMIHLILAVVGLVVLVAGFAGPGRVWVIGWLAASGLLVLVMSLAVADAWRTRRYLRRKLPELQRKTLGNDPAE